MTGHCNINRLFVLQSSSILFRNNSPVQPNSHLALAVSPFLSCQYIAFFQIANSIRATPTLMALAAIATIYVSSVTSQRQANSSSSQQTSSVASSTTSNIANNRTNNTNIDYPDMNTTRSCY